MTLDDRLSIFSFDTEDVDSFGREPMFKRAKADVLSDLLEIIGEDESFVEATNKPTEKLNKLGTYIKGQNELRQELRKKVKKYCE